jgi:hypothetical protein
MMGWNERGITSGASFLGKLFCGWAFLVRTFEAAGRKRLVMSIN